MSSAEYGFSATMQQQQSSVSAAQLFQRNQTIVAAGTISEPEDMGSIGPEPVHVKQHHHRRLASSVRGWLDYRGVIMTSIYEGTMAYYLAVIVIGIAASNAYPPGFAFALALGFGYAAMSFLPGNVAIMPIVSLTRAIAWELPWGYCVAHIISQFIGDMLAAVTIRFGGNTLLTAAVPHIVMAGLPAWAGFIYLFITSLALGLGVLVATYRDWDSVRSIMLGFLLTALCILLGPYVTGSLDPFVTLAIMIVDLNFPAECWIYFVGPVVGSISSGIFSYILHWNHIHSRTACGGDEVQKGR